VINGYFKGLYSIGESKSPLPPFSPTTTLFHAQSSSCDESNKPHDFSSESTLLAEELIRDLFPGLGAAPE
jgi:hypothetical protein